MRYAALEAAVRELEGHVAGRGWDQPGRLFALVETADLLAREPDLAGALGVEPGGPAPEGLTPVEQDPLPADRALEDVLAGIVWPAEVAGCAAAVERLVLPPDADDAVPDDPAAAREYAAAHPDRQEVRIVAAAGRDGGIACALRLRSQDSAESVVTGPDLVPGLTALLQATLDLEEIRADE